MSQEMKQGTDSIEASKLEWGPEPVQMDYAEAQVKVLELNAGLNEGEKLWRLPTTDELVAVFNNKTLISDGFKGGYYWSSIENKIKEANSVYVVDTNSGSVVDGDMFNKIVYLRLVRDAA
jgi:DNA-binding beta-propeller fold protein YncE